MFYRWRPRSDSFVEFPYEQNFSAPIPEVRCGSMGQSTSPHTPQRCLANPHQPLSRQRSAPVVSKWNTQAFESRLPSPQLSDEQVKLTFYFSKLFR